MGFALTERDRAMLRGVHPDLVRVVERAATLSPIRFRVVDGLRTIERQRELVRQGVSKTLNSRHLTGHAVDLVPAVDLNEDGKVTGDEMWNHKKLIELSPFIKQAFKLEKVPYEWGGDWRNAWDKPHWQLPWKAYPVERKMGFLSSDANEIEVVQDEPRMETPAVTPAAARIGVEGGAALGGTALLGDAVAELGKADQHFSAGTAIGLAIGSIILIGAALSFYDRWDAAGRPLPGFLRRIVG